MKMNRIRLVLEDKNHWWGRSATEEVHKVGEVVFNTSMVGYEDIITDPAYSGQLVVMTYPLIGNYGVNETDADGEVPYVAGLITREIANPPTDTRNRSDLQSYLQKNEVPLGSNFDTRAVTRHLRNEGNMKGLLTSDCESPVEKLAEEATTTDIHKVAPANVCEKPYTVGDGQFRAVIMDFGIRKSLIETFVSAKIRCTVVPPTHSADEITAYQPDVVVLSNGPGDPKNWDAVLPTVRKLSEIYPVLGICLGHQIVARAFGAKTSRMSFGHRGVNHPVCDLTTGRSHVTVQNHGYVIVKSSLSATDLQVTHKNLNDNSVEGVRHCELAVMGLQFHPQTATGVRESLSHISSFLSSAGLEVIANAAAK